MGHCTGFVESLLPRACESRGESAEAVETDAAIAAADLVQIPGEVGGILAENYIFSANNNWETI